MMDWQLIIQVLGVVGGILVSVFQLRGRLPKSRSTLKHDLEILGLMDEADPLHPVVKNAIDSRIREIYQTPAGRSKTPATQQGGVISSVAIVVLFSIWTAYALKDGFSWIALPTSLIVILALLAVIGFMTPDDEAAQKTSATTSNDTSPE